MILEGLKKEGLNGFKYRKQPPEVFYKKAVFKNYSIFTGKHVSWSLFLIKLQAFNSIPFKTVSLIYRDTEQPQEKETS